MKLIRSVRSLEASAAARKRAHNGPVGICLTADFVALDRSELDPDAVVVTDWRLLARDPLYLRVDGVERLQRGAADLGQVFDSDGTVVGRVVSDEGVFTFVEWLDVGGVQPYRSRSRGSGETVRRAGRR